MITYHDKVEQGSDEWLQLRCGMVTASEVKHLLTPTLRIADNDKAKSYMYSLLAQRISGFTDPHYVSDDMLRGQEDEIDARILYNEKYAPLTETGFVVNTSLGFPVGYSPDGLVGDNGLIEVKSRRQKFQVQTILEYVPQKSVPQEYMAQIQMGLFVTGRKWCDFISYSGGFPMVVIRIYPDSNIQEKLIEAITEFEVAIQEKKKLYDAILAENNFINTERRIIQEIYL